MILPINAYDMIENHPASSIISMQQHVGTIYSYIIFTLYIKIYGTFSGEFFTSMSSKKVLSFSLDTYSSFKCCKYKFKFYQFWIC